MRKYLFLLFFLFVSSAFAQSELKLYFDFNLSGYYNVPQGESTSAKTGLGVGCSYLYGRKFYVEPGFLYAEHRHQYSVASDMQVTTSKVKEQMLKVPLHLGVHVLGNEESPCSLRLYLGPTYACSLKSSVKVKEVGDLDDKIDFKKSRWGADAGLGFNVYFFFIDVLYEHEFSRFSEDVDKRNLGMQVNAGFRYTFRAPRKK